MSLKNNTVKFRDAPFNLQGRLWFSGGVRIFFSHSHSTRLEPEYFLQAYRSSDFFFQPSPMSNFFLYPAYLYRPGLWPFATQYWYSAPKFRHLAPGLWPFANRFWIWAPNYSFLAPNLARLRRLQQISYVRLPPTDIFHDPPAECQNLGAKTTVLKAKAGGPKAKTGLKSGYRRQFAIIMLKWIQTIGAFTCTIDLHFISHEWKMIYHEVI